MAFTFEKLHVYQKSVDFADNGCARLDAELCIGGPAMIPRS